MFIVPVYVVLCYTEAKHGLCWVCKRKKSTLFIYVASVVFLKFDGNIKSLTRKCWDVLDSPLCTLPSASVDFAGLVMFLEWVTNESQSRCCTASWSMAHANVVVQHYVLRMSASATYRAWMSVLINERSLLMTATNGHLLYTEILKKETSNSLRNLRRRRILIGMSFVCFVFFFVALLCLSCFSLVYFTYKYFWAQSRTVDFGWQRAY